MYELMHLQFARQRHEKMMREAERERLVKVKEAPGHLFKNLKARKTVS
ncbi:MAG: hypothetical protein ACR2JR_04700 [Rubrobacteraceae bacterium]